MKRLVSVSTLCVLAAVALALPAFVKTFTDTYKPKAGSELSKAKCMTCHEGKMGGKLNPYGTDLMKALGTSKAITPAILKKVEKLDSDKDGMKNIDEIKAGRLPGKKG